MKGKTVAVLYNRQRNPTRLFRNKYSQEPFGGWRQRGFFGRNIYQRRQLPRGVVYLLERNELAVKLIYLMVFVINAHWVLRYAGELAIY